jgi:serine/threonine-protein kinase RsbW
MKRALKSRRAFLLAVQLVSDPHLLSAVRGVVERLMDILEFPEEEGRAVVRAVDEAVSNIMRHSYRGRMDQPIEVRVSRLENGARLDPGQGVEIVLIDKGPACDTTKIEARSLDEVRPGGLGLHIIRESMDSVVYKRDGGRNRLHLVRYSRSPSRTQHATAEKPS